MNHVEQSKLQLKQNPLPFPVLELNDSIKSKEFKDIILDDFNIVGYLYNPSIKAEMSI
jgi:thymidylate synthase